MKHTNNIKKLLMVLAFTFSMAILLPTVSPITTQAATNKVTSTTNYKKSPKIKKGKNCVIAKKADSYIKFIAPSDGKYKFTVYNFNTIGKPEDICYTNIHFEKPSTSGYPTLTTIKTEGGKYSCLFMTNKYCYERFQKPKIKKVKTTDHLAKRTCTLSMKKGETIYLKFYFTDYNSKKCSYNIDIKKK